MPLIPKAFALVAVCFWLPFVCLFLPVGSVMGDGVDEAPSLKYTTILHLTAHFFYFVPMLIADSLRPLNVGWTFLVAAFVQSSLFTLLLWLLFFFRWRQVNSASRA
jgi:hypothetical protein